MLNIFKRLSRLARSELNSLADKIRSPSESNESTNDVQDGLQAELDAATQQNEWPKEIREAYASLELPLGSDEAAVKQAYRELTKRYHPDRHHDQNASDYSGISDAEPSGPRLLRKCTARP